MAKAPPPPKPPAAIMPDLTWTRPAPPPIGVEPPKQPPRPKRKLRDRFAGKAGRLLG